MALTTIAFNATLKTAKEPVLYASAPRLDFGGSGKLDIRTTTVRLADHNIKPGVTSDEGDALPRDPKGAS